MRTNRRIFALAAALSLLPSVLSVKGLAQQAIALSNGAISLPDAPVPQQSSPPAGTASVSGIVRDTDGAVIPAAQISLFLRDGKPLQSVKSDASGGFVLTNVPVGTYYAIAEASGFASVQTKEFTVTAQQSYVLPGISLTIAGLNTSITVRPAEEIAAEQIKEEEQQRLIGIFPNFYVSYVPDAAPLNAKQKFTLAAHSTFDWTRFVEISMGAGIAQAGNQFSGYGQGAAGYGKRWAALFAFGTSSGLLSRYAFASLLHQDPRYFYQGTGTKKSRFYHAVSSAFVARSDSGKKMPNYAYLLGNLSAAALSTAYFPPENRGAGLVFSNAAIGIGGRAAAAVIQEFLAKSITKNAPQTPEPGNQGSQPHPHHP